MGFVCVFALLYLDVWAGSEPGLVSQHLVDVVKEAKARGRCLQPLQPQRVPAHPQELSRVQTHQVVAVMSCCSLEVRGRGGRRDLEKWPSQTLHLVILSF